MVLRRTNAYAELFIRGRDYGDEAYSMVFDKKTLQWKMEGNALENGLSKEAKRLLRLFKKYPKRKFKLEKISTIVKDKNVQNTENKIARLVNKTLIEKTDRGYYRLDKNTYPELFK